MKITEERVKILKAVLTKSKLNYVKDALNYINILENQLSIAVVSEAELCGICKEPFKIITGKICEQKECVRYK